MSQHDILVLYYTRSGATRDLARFIAEGIESVPGVNARLRTVPAISAVSEATEAPVPTDGAPIWKYGGTHEILLGLQHL